MKKLRLLFTLAAVALATLAACGQKPLIPAVQNIKGVTNVLIGKTMLSMVSDYGPVDDLQPSDLSNLTSVEIINADEAIPVKAIVDEFRKFISSTPDIQVLMQVTDDDQQVRIYGTPISGTENYSRIIFYVLEKYDDDKAISDDDEVSVIVLSGKITPEMIGRLKPD